MRLRLVARSRADVAALHGHRPELLEEVVAEMLEDAERAAASVMEDGGRPRFAPDGGEAGGRQVERRVPSDRAKVGIEVFSIQRGEQSLGGVLERQEVARPVAEEALGDRMLLVPLELRDPPILDRGDDGAGVRAVAVAGGALAFDHDRVRTGGDGERLGCATREPLVFGRRQGR